MPESVPLAANEFGPSTTAPLRNGGPFGGDATRFVTWCCMQRGNTVPSSTTRDVPHALVPRTLASHRLPEGAYAVLPVRLSYSAAITTHPKPSELVSYTLHLTPNP